MADTDKSPIVDRLIQFIEYTGLTSTQFADKAGIPRPSLSQILHGRNKSVNNQLLAKLNSAFPQLNIVWLLFNQGNMLTSGNIEISQGQNGPKSASFRRELIDDEDIDSFTDTDLQSLFSTQSRDLGAPSDTNLSSQRRSDGNSRISTPSPTLSTSINQDGIIETSEAETTIANQPSEVKKISSIIVFYTDGTFSTFRPAEEQI